ncbi:hypothetical protein [Clostridium sp.]|uniref:hypothetical protein n=1 Tax=Clostridium sp. TaxID=1506 RepID=UPI0025BEC3BF|nr:hypothetical protein [Clostridium sp.]
MKKIKVKENSLKIAIIYLIVFVVSTVIFIYDPSNSDPLLIVEILHPGFATKHLVICTILFLILTISFKVKNKALNIYFLVMMIMCITMSMSSKFSGYQFDIETPFILWITYPFGYYLSFLIEIKKITQYRIVIILSYFIILSILHVMSTKFIDIIKNKLN